MHQKLPSSFRCLHLQLVVPAAAAWFALSPAFAQGTVPALIAAQVPGIASAPSAAPAQRASLEPLALPDAPSASSSSVSGDPAPDPAGQIANQKEGSQPSLNPLQRLATPRIPTPTDVVVAPGQIGPHQTARDKLIASLRDSISPFSIAGEIISAGYSQGVDSSPNYGRDFGAFGQRVGASVARGTSQDIFSEGVLAAVLHEDPRYYQLGSRQNFFKRVVYAGTRPVIGRTDSGRTTLNLSIIGGYLGAAALSQTYYPARNQGFDNVLQTWGTGIGGNAIGDEVTEFLPDVLQFLHLKRVNHY